MGCHSIGPRRVNIDRETYNNVVLKTEQEQLLMNIVRLRYLEGTQYIQISAITAGYSMSETLGGSVSTTSTPPNILSSLASNISPTVTYSDSPTISYTPMGSMEFTKSLLTPTTMVNFLLLSHAGRYDYTMLYSLFLEAIGDVDANLLNIEGSDYLTPQYVTYIKTISLMNKLYRQGAFEVPRAISYQKNLGALLRFHKKYTHAPEAIKLKKIFKVPLESRDLIFMEHTVLEELQEKDGSLGFGNPKSNIKNIIYIRFRSLFSIMSVLARGVQVPSPDLSAHVTKELIQPDGMPFDWRKEMRDFLTIYSCEKEPRDDVLVKIYFHHYWFYIKNSDLASKDTFAAIQRLFILSSADSANPTTPILTIPVSAPGK